MFIMCNLQAFQPYIQDSFTFIMCNLQTALFYVSYEKVVDFMLCSSYIIAQLVSFILIMRHLQTFQLGSSCEMYMHFNYFNNGYFKDCSLTFTCTICKRLFYVHRAQFLDWFLLCSLSEIDRNFHYVHIAHLY